MMKIVITVIFWALLTLPASVSSDDSEELVRLFASCIPDNWTVAVSTDAGPIRGLSHPAAQLIFTESNRWLTCDESIGHAKAFHPTLLLQVFLKDRQQEVESASKREHIRSDYPPLVVGFNDQYIFVTSPGYINQGLRSPEADAVLTDLWKSFARCMTVEYHIGQDTSEIQADTGNR
ncbi:hypothetical protein JW979_01665 [bacterium]|nr:hypothetical protein [candidate division CSSED10-310 bacterium]